jgi:hypothetical protein
MINVKIEMSVIVRLEQCNVCLTFIELFKISYKCYGKKTHAIEMFYCFKRTCKWGFIHIKTTKEQWMQFKLLNWHNHPKNLFF